MPLDNFETFQEHLSKTHGASIGFEDYYPSHGRRLKFNVSMSEAIEEGISTVLTLILSACDRYCGPFFWKNSKLQIIDSGDRYTLIDPSVGFEIDFQSASFHLPFLAELEKYGERHHIAFSGREHVDIDRLMEMNLELPAKFVYLPSKDGIRGNPQC